MSFYYYNRISDIIRKLYDRWSTLEQWEYDSLIECCRGYGSDAQMGRDALKAARDYGYPQFKFVKRVSSDEYYYVCGW